MQYYIHDGKTQKGPYSKDEVKALNISPDTLVWHEGLDEWTQAKNVFQFAPTPPPLKKMPPVLSSITPEPSEYSKPQKASHSEPPKKSLLKPALIVVTAFFVIVFGLPIIGEMFSSTTPTYQEYRAIENTVNNVIEDRAEKERKQKYANDIASYLNPHFNDYKKDPIFGNVWDVQVKIDNNTPYTMDKVFVSVSYLGMDRSVIKTEAINFHNLKPGVRQILEASGCKGAYDITCRVDRVESDELY